MWSHGAATGDNPQASTAKPNGFKFYAIRPGSILDALGRENGDTLHRINGQDFGGEAAVPVWDSIRSDGEWVAEFTRRGRPLSLAFRAR